MYSIDTNPDRLHDFEKATDAFKKSIEDEISNLERVFSIFEGNTRNVDLSELKWQMNEIKKIISEGSFSLIDLKGKINNYFNAVTRIRSILEK